MTPCDSKCITSITCRLFEHTITSNPRVNDPVIVLLLLLLLLLLVLVLVLPVLLLVMLLLLLLYKPSGIPPAAVESSFSFSHGSDSPSSS